MTKRAVETQRLTMETAPKTTPQAPDSGWGGVLTNFCLLVLAGALVGLAAPWLVRLWLGFDVLTHFVPHFAFVALAAFLCILYPNARGLLALLVVPALGALAIAGISHWRESPGFTGPPPSGHLRVMAYNSWLRNDDLAAMEAEIRRNRPDILGVPEFFAGKRPLMTRLRDILPHQADCVDKRHCYLALFSRWPIRKVHAASLWEGPPYIHATVETPNGPVEVFLVHTLRFPWLGSQFRQVRAMARIVKLAKGPTIVMGDFNASPFSIMLHTFARDTGLRRLTWLPTWPANPLPLPQIAIDHVFVSDHWNLAAGPWTGRAAGSDHRSVILEVRRRD